MILSVELIVYRFNVIKTEFLAGPSKLRKEGDCNLNHDDETCAVCVQRINRIERLKGEDVAKEETEALKKFEYTKLSERCASIKGLIRTFIPHEFVRILEMTETEEAPQNKLLAIKGSELTPTTNVSKVLMMAIEYILQHEKHTASAPLALERWNAATATQSTQEFLLSKLMDIMRESTPTSSDTKINVMGGLNGYAYNGHGDSTVVVKNSIPPGVVVPSLMQLQQALPRGSIQPAPPNDVHYHPYSQLAAPAPSTLRSYGQPPNQYPNNAPAAPYYQGARVMPPMYATRPNAPPPPGPSINTNTYAGPPRFPPPPHYYPPYQ